MMELRMLKLILLEQAVRLSNNILTEALGNFSSALSKREMKLATCASESLSNLARNLLAYRNP